MGDSPGKKTIRFDSVSNSIRFDSIWYSQSAHILVRVGRLRYCSSVCPSVTLVILA